MQRIYLKFTGNCAIIELRKQKTRVEIIRMENKGIITKGVGGLYTVLLDSDEELKLRARGSFRHDGLTPTVGDYVEVDGGFITEILPRSTILERPSVANLDVLCIVISAANPAPVLQNVDKLTCLARFHGIEPVIIVTKYDLDREFASELRETYKKCGYEAFLTSSESGWGLDEAKERFLNGNSRLCAFAGASGAGKSTLLGLIFGDKVKRGDFETGEVSPKTGRGRNTTRSVTLHRIGDGSQRRFLADTPGFSMLDFAQAADFTREELPSLFPELEPYLDAKGCRYADCTHTKEEDCAVRRAAESGIIPASRRASYLALWDELKDKRKWNLKS